MIVCDTGVLVEAADPHHAHHNACVRVLAEHADEFHATMVALAERLGTDATIGADTAI